MAKIKTNDIVNLMILSIILIRYVGIKASINLLYQMLKIFNTILLQLCNISVLSFVFKYCITFPIVSIILSVLGSPRGKKGQIISKIFYFIIGYIICLVLDLIAKYIF